MSFATKMVNRQILLLSSSQVHGYGFLEHSKATICGFLQRNNVREVTFVPYAHAHSDYDGYTKKISDVLTAWGNAGFHVRGIHTADDQIAALKKAECVFVGGGNTFVLLKKLIELELIEPIRHRVLETAMPYMGSSAGTNVATFSIHTTNDMPIVHPPSFSALNLVPFNINPHYMDADADSKHKGETRETRINEFHAVNETPVVGLREGTCILFNGEKATLLGSFNARLFIRNKEPQEIPPSSDLSWLL